MENRTYEIEAKNRWHAAGIVDYILCNGKGYGLSGAYHRGSTVILTCTGEPRRSDRFRFLADLFRKDFTA